MKFIRALAIVFALLIGTPALASDSDRIGELLHAFMAHAHVKSAHETFWADDLVYTSSDGSRFGKADILSGFEDAESADEPALAYSAEDVIIRVFGKTAVVTFKLVGTPKSVTPEQPILYFYNTGTFLKRGGSWQVLAWQATKIPAEE